MKINTTHNPKTERVKIQYKPIEEKRDSNVAATIQAAIILAAGYGVMIAIFEAIRRLDANGFIGN